MDNKTKPTLNMRYYNIYDEEGDVVDEDTIAKFCEGDGKGDDEDEFE